MTSTVWNNVFTEIETWGEGAVSAFEQLGLGILSKFTAESLAAVGAAAQEYKTEIAGGATQSAAWAAAYNTLAAAEGVALTDAELGLADAIIEISGGTA